MYSNQLSIQKLTRNMRPRLLEWMRFGSPGYSIISISYKYSWLTNFSNISPRLEVLPNPGRLTLVFQVVRRCLLWFLMIISVGLRFCFKWQKLVFFQVERIEATGMLLKTIVNKYMMTFWHFFHFSRRETLFLFILCLDINNKRDFFLLL